MTTKIQSDFPPIASLIPHAGAMVLLDRVLSHSAEATLCERTIRAGDIFLRHPQQDIPVWIGIEYMAQCVAVHARLLMQKQDLAEAAPRGFLVGTRRTDFCTPSFRLGQRLQISAKPATGFANFLAFECEIHDSDTNARLAAGQIHIFIDHGTGKNAATTTKE